MSKIGQYLQHSGSDMRTIKSLLLASVSLPAILGTIGCTSVPVTGRKGLDLVDDQAVTKESMAAFAQMKASEPISTNAAYNERLQRVGARLAEVVFWDIPDARWEFVLFEKPTEINAFAMAGGKVGVYTGVLRLVDSDDELAVVLAHEIAHVSAKHVHEGLSQQMMVETGSYAVSMIPVGYGTVGSLTSQAIYSAYGLGTGVVGLSFDRDKEREADKMGLIYMARAGYNPNAAMTFWNKVDQADPGQHPSAGWMSSHPSHANRVSELREIMPTAEGIYESVVASGVWE